MISKIERVIAFRYLKPKKKEGFLKVISIFSFTGIALGVAILIIVMSVMNGFRTELINKILGFNPHIIVKPYDKKINKGDLNKLTNLNDEIQRTSFTFSGQGIIINKELYRGNGGAGEFGQMTIKFNGMIGNCGNDGSIEEYISTRGIMRLAESFGMRKVETPEDIYVSAMKNNLNATSLYREVGIYLGIEITNLINAFDPEIVVVGGDLTKAWKFFGHHMKEEIKQRALFNPKIVKGKLGKNSKIVGASCLVD